MPRPRAPRLSGRPSARLVALALALIGGVSVSAAGGDAFASPPTGRRTPRPRPTHVVVVATDIALRGAVARLEPGVGVALAGAGRRTPSGRVVATVTGPVELTGRVAGGVLGQRLARDVEARSSDGRTAIGAVHAGALVLVAATAPAGTAIVTTVGPVRARLRVPADALTAEPVELVYRTAAEPSARTLRATELRAAAGRARARARLDAGTRVSVLEERPRAVRVRTWGGVALDGWVARDDLTREATGSPPTPVAPLAATHEVFVDTALRGQAGGRSRLGQLLGGALVTVKAARGDWRRVRTVGDVMVEGWVRVNELRALEPETIADRP